MKRTVFSILLIGLMLFTVGCTTQIPQRELNLQNNETSGTKLEDLLMALRLTAIVYDESTFLEYQEKRELEVVITLIEPDADEMNELINLMIKSNSKPLTNSESGRFFTANVTKEGLNILVQHNASILSIYPRRVGQIQ